MTRGRLVFNLLLAAGVLALAAALWFTHEPPAPAPAPVSTIATEKIERIEIHHGDDVIVLARVDGRGWRMREPVAASADPERVSALLELAATVPKKRYERGAIDARSTGLEPPTLTLRFNAEAPIALGGHGPARSSRYVRTAHALLVVEAAKLEDDLLSEPLSWPHWVAPDLLGAGERLQRLTLPQLTLERGENASWRVTPANADRGADYARATVSAWRHARARTVEVADHARQRSARVTLRFVDAPIRQLDVIAREPELVLRDPALGVDYHLAANRAAPLLDMAHPAALGDSRADRLQPSAIPLTADAIESQ